MSQPAPAAVPASAHGRRAARARALTPAQRAARQQQIVAHLGLVRALATRFSSYAGRDTAYDFDDLVAAGTEGLITAVDTYADGHGAAFSSWAVLKIRGAIIDALRALDPVSPTVRQTQRRIAGVAEQLAQRQAAWPTPTAIAAALGESPVAVETALQLRQPAQSLDQPGLPVDAGEERGTLAETLASTDGEGDPAARWERLEQWRALRAAVATLPVREQVLIAEHYGHGTPLQVIAARFGVSSGRMTQLHHRALRLLRAQLDQPQPGSVRPHRPQGTLRRAA